MSGLDGLGWPNPEDEPKPKETMNSQLEIKLAPTPETDDATLIALDIECGGKFEAVHVQVSKRLERERDVAQKAMGDVRDVLLDAMPDANAPTKILAKIIVAERDSNQEQADALVDRLGATQERMINAERELTGVTEQRDRLAAVLQRIRDGYGGQAAAPDCCEDCEFLIPIDEALQSLNQPTEMTDERWGYGAGTSRAGLRITNQSERLVPVAITPLFIIL